MNARTSALRASWAHQQPRQKHADSYDAAKHENRAQQHRPLTDPECKHARILCGGEC